MKKLIILMLLLITATSFALSPSANNARTTFRNGYAWGGNIPRDRATAWAQQVEAAAEIGFGLGTGKVFYVDSGVANEGDGDSWDSAKDTLDEAVNLCTANRGDFILVAQGHTEVMGAAADEVDIDVAGVTVIGVGKGTLRPLFDYTGTVTGAFAIGAGNVTLVNLVFKANVTDVNEAIDIESAGDWATITSCDFLVESGATDEFDSCIELGDAADRAVISNCLFDMKGGAAIEAIHLDFDTDGMIITNNIIRGDYSTACISGDTTLSTDLTISENILMNGISGVGGLNSEPAIEVLDGTGGIIAHNYIISDVATHLAMRVADDMIPIENWSTAIIGDDTQANDANTASITVSEDG